MLQVLELGANTSALDPCCSLCNCPADVFVVNEEFQSRMFRIRLNAIQLRSAPVQLATAVTLHVTLALLLQGNARGEQENQ